MRNRLKIWAYKLLGYRVVRGVEVLDSDLECDKLYIAESGYLKTKGYRVICHRCLIVDGQFGVDTSVVKPELPTPNCQLRTVKPELPRAENSELSTPKG